MTRKALMRRLGALGMASVITFSALPAMATISYEGGTLSVIAPIDEKIPDRGWHHDHDRGHDASIGFPVPVTPVGPATIVKTEKDNKEEALTLYVNGKSIDKPLYFSGKTLLLPVRAIASRTGWSYSYRNGKATLTKGDNTVTIASGSKTYTKNGSSYKLNTSSKVISDSLYIPWQFFEKALGMNVSIGSSRVKVSSSSSSKSNSSMYSLRVNGKKSSAAPYYNGDILMLPLRFTVETLGYGYTNDSTNRQAIFNAKNIDTFMTWDQNRFPVDNEYVELECKPEIKNNTLYVPASFMTKALKCEMTISSNGRNITLTR